MAQKLRFARSGRKHRVAMHRVRAGMHHSGCPEVDEATGALYFTGRDTRGRLHHIGVFEARENVQLMIIFHAQPLEW